MLPLEPGETIVRTVHRTIFGLVAPTFIAFILIVGGIGSLALSTLLASDPNLSPLQALLQIAALILLLLGVVWFLIAFILWRKNQLVLTDQNLIDVNAQSIFSQNVHRLALDKIHSVQGFTTDFLSALFGYGRLEVQTGDGLTTLSWDYLPHVQQLVADIEAARQPAPVKETP